MNTRWLVTVGPSSHPSPAHYVQPAQTEQSGVLLDGLLEKLASAERLGRELAHRSPELVEKTAMAGLVAGLGAAAPKLLNAGRAVAGTMMRNPTKALALGGAAAGGIAGGLKDPGQGGSRLGGALTGAALGGAAGFGASKIPGAAKMVQGQGRALSQNIRGSQWQNSQYSGLGGSKVAGVLDLARGVAKNPIARRAAMGGALGAASGGDEHHTSGAVTGALLAGVAGAGGGARAAPPARPGLPSSFLSRPAAGLKPLVPQGGATGVGRAAVAHPPAAPGAHDSFARVDPHAATMAADGSKTKASIKTRAGMGPQVATSVTRADPLARASMKSLQAG